MTLKTLQSDFQEYILKNNLTILKNITQKNRLSIYQNSYYARIITAMKQDFPRLCESLGDSAFASLVTDYINTFPSKNFNLRYVGKDLAHFIASKDPDFAPYAEMAQAEWLMLMSGLDKF